MAASGEVDLEHQLADAYGLDLCQVVTDLHQDELPLAALGVAGSKFLADEIGQRAEAADRRQPRPHAARLCREPRPGPCAAPPRRRLMGGLTRSAHANPHEIVSRLVRAHRRRGHVSCRCRSWPTPPATAQCCSASAEVAAAYELARRLRPDARRHRHHRCPRRSSSTTGMVEARRDGGDRARRRRRRDARPLLRRARPPGRERAHRSAS